MTAHRANGDETVESYNRAAAHYARTLLGHEDVAQLQTFEKYVPQESNVLDVGCAAGRDTATLSKMGYDAIGLDPAEKLLEIARSSYPELHFERGDMRDLPFDDKEFGGVWASAVLHHVSRNEMPGVLAEFWRVLKPGGVAYIHTKAGAGTLTTQEETVGGHTRNFELLEPDELDAMMHEQGFEKLELEVVPSKSREGLFWANGYYRKPATA